MLKRNKRVILLVLFLVGLIGFLGFRVWQVKKTKRTEFFPKKSSFSLQPPSEALTGKLIKAVGEIKKEPRDSEEFEKIGEEEEILDGEKLATDEKSKAVVEFADFAQFTLGSNSEVDFASLLPASFVIKQKQGAVDYKLLEDNTPLNVRVLHALLSFYSGESKVIVENEEVIVKVLSGKAKLALVDLDNKTHIWKLEEGQTALVDDSQRRVEIK